MIHEFVISCDTREGTPMLLHERDFNKAAARRLSMTDSALRRIDLTPQNPRHLP